MSVVLSFGLGVVPSKLRMGGGCKPGSWGQTDCSGDLLWPFLALDLYHLL